MSVAKCNNELSYNPDNVQNQVVLLAPFHSDPALTGRASSTAAAQPGSEHHSSIRLRFRMFTLAKQKQCFCNNKKRVEKNQHPTVGLLMCCHRAKEALRLTRGYRNGAEHVVQKHTYTVCCESQLHHRLNNTATDTRCAPMITDIANWKGAESAIPNERNESVSSDFSRLVVAQENYTIKFSNSDRKHSVFESSSCQAKRPILLLLRLPFRVLSR